MNLNITILEDNKQDYLLLSEEILHWAETEGHSANITWIDSYDTFNKLFLTIKCDIFFSDIELDCENSSSGLNACKKLRRFGYSGIIIFLTAFKEYVFEGYDVQAFNYLLKPISQKSLNNCLNKFVKLFSNDFYYHHKGNDVFKIPYCEIIYVEKKGHDSIIHTSSEIYVERLSLNEMFNRLPKFFIRSHKSYIVNINKIKSLKLNELFLVGDNTIPVGRSFLPDIKKKLLELVR